MTNSLMAGGLGSASKHRPADSVTLIFLLFLNVVTITFYPVVPRAYLLITLYSALIFVQIALIRFKDKGVFTAILYDLVFPVICVLLIFDSLEGIVHYVNPTDIDPFLIRLDFMIFGNHPTVLLEKMTFPVLTDFLQLAYSTYYFIPVSFGAVLLMRHRRKEFEKSLFLILFCFYLSYLGYILFPALGPRFYLKDFQTTELQGFLVSEALQNLLNRLEGIKRDAFPSGHTAITMVVLYLAFKFEKSFFRICLPIVAALIFATVYCRYHYVVDVIAGFVLTFITIALGERYYAWWERRQPSPVTSKEKKLPLTPSSRTAKGI